MRAAEVPGASGRSSTALKNSDLDDPQKRHGIRAAIHLANFYEFLAIGIRRGDLLEEFLYETVRGQMVNLYDRVWPAPEWQRSIDRRKPSRRYAALMDLARQWRTEHEHPNKQ